MEKSTIKRIIECAAGSCASFAAGVILGRFMPEGGLAKKVIFSIGSILIGEVVGDTVARSSALTTISDAVADALGTSKNDISEEAKEETKEETTNEIFCDGNSEEVKEDSVEAEKATEETNTEEVTEPVVPSFVKTMENLYSGMEILLTFLTSKRLIRLLKVKKPLSVMTTVLCVYVIVAWCMERTKVDVYYGNSSNKEAIA